MILPFCVREIPWLKSSLAENIFAPGEAKIVVEMCNPLKLQQRRSRKLAAHQLHSESTQSTEQLSGD
jgi:hypothetical protein